MIRIALVEDHASLRHAMAFMLAREADLEVAVQVGTFTEAVALLPSVSIDVALLDLELPDGNGLDLLPMLHTHAPDVAVLVLTGNPQPERPALAVAAGAAGFVPKTAAMTEIMAAIRRVAAGSTLFSATEAVTLMREAARYQAQMQGIHEGVAQLTARERDVLEGLVAGLDDRAIADRLFLSVPTVRTHVSHVLRKLEARTRLQAAMLAVRYGVVKLDDRD